MTAIDTASSLDRVPASFAPRSLRFDTVNPIELQVLTGIARGLSSKEIARELQRSPATIESYIRLLLARFNARTRCHLVARSIREGVLDPCVSD